MTRNEWYESAEFKKHRLLNNLASDITFKLQQIRDVLEIIEDGKFLVGDAFSLAERQLRILQLEARKLEEYLNRCNRILTPVLSDGVTLPQRKEDNAPDLG